MERLFQATKLSLSILTMFAVSGAANSYSNVTLTSLGGDMSVVIYLPPRLKPTEPVYYYGSRFDHGSMIGEISRRIKDYDDKTGKEQVKQHVLYATGQWREPHNSHWPESGIGLASEFGVGDNGDQCVWRCGWTKESDVTNGLLGYAEAKNGESFLKIGVGELIKGSCPACDSTDVYMFNSPYMFVAPPDWSMSQTKNNSGLRLENKAQLREYGYKLVKDITLINNVLTVTNTLTNLGDKPFKTAWYSHHLFTCDGNCAGPGYSIDLKLQGDRNTIYEEPGTWSWSTPLSDYADIEASQDSIHVGINRDIDLGIKIKAEFLDDSKTKGAFTLNACDSSVDVTIPELENPDVDMPMYAYNLYIERGTLSPEPQILLKLQGGESKSWTQRLVIRDFIPDKASQNLIVPTISGLPTIGASIQLPSTNLPGVKKLFAIIAIAVTATYIVLLLQDWSNWFRQRQYYSSIPDTEC